jgi:hypothetical protein
MAKAATGLTRTPRADAQRIPSLPLLRTGAAQLGLSPRRSRRGLSLRIPGGRCTFRWGARKDPPKSTIPEVVLAAKCRVLRSVTGVRVVRLPRIPPWIPGCSKPDIGTRGVGVALFRSVEQWNAARRPIRAAHVLQPLLRGREYRATVCYTGAYAVARLSVQRAGIGKWRDAPHALNENSVRDLQRIVNLLSVPVLGADLIKTRDALYLVDINLTPSLGIHLATNRPRDMATHVLESIISLTRKQ